MNISSPAFDNNEKIPKRFTCDGENISPKLLIEDVPKEAESLVLIMDDPDAPPGEWIHWLVWNIDPDIDEIEEGVYPDQAIQGVNSSGSQAYQGPCPPTGTHRYVFKLYALKEKIDLSADSDRDDLLIAMNGLVIDQAELTGVYSRE